MTGRECKLCGSALSAWEPNPCACDGAAPVTNAQVMYALACSVEGPLHLRDFVRLADVEYGRSLHQATANATIAPDFRFCWTGKGLYALFRQGPLPGPRNLEEAARLILCGSGRALTLGAIEFTLKSVGYRFTNASLYNAIGRSPVIEWRWWDGHFHVGRTPDSVRDLLERIPVLPAHRRSQWPQVREHIEHVVERAMDDRAERLRDVDSRTAARYDWD